MKKWTAIDGKDEAQRWQTLSEALRAAGCENEYVPWAGDAEKWDDLTALEAFDHVRLGGRSIQQVIRNVKVQSSWTTLLGVVDGMTKTPYGWWPLCALYESFTQVLISLGQDIDTRGSVLMAGAGGSARIAIGAFFKAGFQNFLVTNLAEDEALELIQDVKGKFFGLTIQWVPMERIVLLPGESTVIVNCTPGVKENALLEELSYLNFLKRPGFLFDLSRNAKPTVLLQEARDAGVKAVTGWDLAARSDVLWAKWAFSTDLALIPYQESLLKL